MRDCKNLMRSIQRFRKKSHMKKYEIKNGEIYSARTGEAIPTDEPIFIIRAHDALAQKTLGFYKYLCTMNGISADHIEGVAQMIKEFNAFTEKERRMKMPGLKTKDAPLE